jgi:hypothetical protein
MKDVWQTGTRFELVTMTVPSVLLINTLTVSFAFRYWILLLETVDTLLACITKLEVSATTPLMERDHVKVCRLALERRKFKKKL